jgi:hypothetical protein
MLEEFHQLDDSHDSMLIHIKKNNVVFSMIKLGFLNLTNAHFHVSRNIPCQEILLLTDLALYEI